MLRGMRLLSVFSRYFLVLKIDFSGLWNYLGDLFVRPQLEVAFIFVYDGVQAHFVLPTFR